MDYFYAIGLSEWNEIDVVCIDYEEELEELAHRYSWLTKKRFETIEDAKEFIILASNRTDLPLVARYALLRCRGGSRGKTKYCLDK